VKEDGTDDVAVTVVRDNGNMDAVDVIVTPSTGTAGAADFNATPITVSFADKQISQNVSMSGIVIDDNIGGESNEALNLTLSLANGAPAGATLGGIAAASLSIVDNDSSGTFAFSAGQFTVTESGTGVVPVTIVRTGGSFGSANLVVSASAIAGGATAGVDFSTTPTTVAFGDGNLSRRVDVPVIDDGDLEPDETVALTLTLASGSSGSVDGQTSATLTIQNDDVARAASAPTITSIAPQTVNEDGSLTGIGFTLADDQSAAAQLTTTATSSNSGLVPNNSISISGTGLTRSISLSPVANGIGSTTITVTVSDGNESSSTSFNVTVNPVNDAPTISQIASQRLNEDGVLSQLVFTVADEEFNVSGLTLSVTPSNSTLFPSSGLVITGSGASRSLFVRSASNLSGAGDITIRASDGVASTEMTFSVVVSPVNDPPVIFQLNDVEVVSGVGVVLIEYQIGDPDSTSGALQAVFHSQNPSLIPASAIESVGTGFRRTLQITAPESGAGIVNVTMTIQDESSSTSRVFTITVLALATPDSLTLDAINHVEIAEDTPIRIPVSIGVSGTLAGPLSYTVTSDHEALLPSGTVSVEGETGDQSFELSPSLNQNGQAGVTFSVTDGRNAVSRSFQLSVLPIDDPPVVEVGESVSMNEDEIGVKTIRVSDVDTPLSELKIDRLSSDRASLLPDVGLSSQLTEDGFEIRLAPAQGQAGDTVVLFRIADQTNAIETQFSVKVVAVDSPPFLSEITAIEMVEDTETTIEFEFGDSDTVASALTLEVRSTNENLFPLEGLSVEGEAPSGRLTIRPAIDGEGAGIIEIIVSDGLSSVKREVQVSVIGINDAPTISGLKDIVINENEEQVVSFELSDPDSALDQLFVAVVSSNPSLIPAEIILVKGVGTERQITLSPVEGQQGTATILIGASDGLETTSSQFDVVVVDPETEGATETVLTISISPSGAVIEWEGEGILQTATEIEGPYSSVSWAKSPFTLSALLGGERYFRVVAP